MTNEVELRLSTVHQIVQPVGDLERAIEFYRDTPGATLITTFDPPGLAFFDLDGVRLMLDSLAGSDHPGSTIYVHVDDRQRTVAELQSRSVVFEREQHLAHRDDAGFLGPAGAEEWTAFFRHPDGNLLAITARVDVEARAHPFGRRRSRCAMITAAVERE